MSQDVSEIHAKLVKFLSEEMERTEHHQAVKVELLYFPPGEYRRDPLKSWHRASEADRPYFDGKQPVYLDRMAQEILETAEYHADSFGTGRHRFKVISHHALGGGRHTHAFVISPSADASAGDVGDMSDLAPSREGLTLQLMRHLENQQRLNKDMMASFAGAMRDAMGQLRDDNERLHELLKSKDEERRSMIVEIEKARSQEHDQAIEAALVTGEIERKKFASKKIFGLLPVAISHFIDGKKEEEEGAGKAGKAKKWKPSPLSIALGELHASLEEDQLEVIQGVLSVEQQIMLGEAVRVAKKGGNIVLPQLVSDLAESLTRDQLAKILGRLRPEQQQAFVRAMTLAQAESEPAAGGKEPAETKPPTGQAPPAPERS